MLKKSTLICMRLFSAFVSAIISVGFLASMCCCNCGSAYADEAGVSSGSSANSEKIDGAENKQNCKDAVVSDDAESEDRSYITAKCMVNKGHTDAFATYISKKGKFVLGTRGDSFPGVNEKHRYNPTLLVFVLGNNTKQSSEGLKFLPKNGSDVPIWGLPQTQDTSKLWPGFATETLGEKSGITGVRFAIKSATVPKGGAVYAYQDDAHGDVTPVIGTPNTKFPHKMYVGSKAHMHVNWIFTKAGKYVLDVEAAGRNEAGSIYKNVQRYTFEVDMDAAASSDNESIAASDEEFNDYSGFVKLEKQKAEEDSDGEESEGEGESDSDSDSDDEESEGENGSDDDDEDSSTSIVINGNNNRVYVTPWPGSKPSGGLANRGSEDEEEAETESSKNNLDSKQSKSKNKNKKTTKKCSTFNDIKEDKLIIKHGHVDLATYSNGSGIGFAVQEDVTGSHVKRDPSKVVFYAGNAAKDGNVWRLPQTQKGSVPWVGWSNQGLHPHKSSKISLESVKGPGSVRIWLQGGLGTKAKTVMSSNGNRTYTIPANTHMHLNWDFSKSGYYTIRLAVSANGKTLAKDFHFAIGVDALKTPMGCSVSEVGGDEGDNVADGDGDGATEGTTEGATDGATSFENGGNGGNSGSNSGSNNNGGSTPLAAASYSGNGGSSFFGGGFASNKSKSGKSKSSKTGRTVKLFGTIGSKSRKGVEAKYASKRVKGLRRSLLSNVKDDESTGISGLFSRNPVLAYSLIIGGVLTVLSVTAAGIWFLYKRGLISLNWLLRY